MTECLAVDIHSQFKLAFGKLDDLDAKINKLSSSKLMQVVNFPMLVNKTINFAGIIGDNIFALRRISVDMVRDQATYSTTSGSSGVNIFIDNICIDTSSNTLPIVGYYDYELLNPNSSIYIAVATVGANEQVQAVLSGVVIPKETFAKGVYAS